MWKKACHFTHESNNSATHLPISYGIRSGGWDFGEARELLSHLKGKRAKVTRMWIASLVSEMGGAAVPAYAFAECGNDGHQLWQGELLTGPYGNGVKE